MSRDKATPAQLKREIADMMREQERAAAILKTLKEVHAKRIGEIRTLILKDKVTTGDRISDFFIGAYGIIDDAEESKPFRDLEAQMAGKRGELFLIVRRQRDRHVFRDGMDQSSRESDYHLTTRYTLGIFSDDKLVLKPKTEEYGLPTQAFVDVEMNERRTEAKKDGPFIFTVLHGFGYIGKMIHGGHDSGPALEVIIGNDAVFTYSPPEFLVAKPRKRPAHWIIALNQAARKLGANIPEAPEEHAAREEEKGRILEQLEKELERRKTLFSKTPVRRPLHGLQECDDQIRTLLARADELGLSEEPEVKLAKKRLGGVL